MKRNELVPVSAPHLAAFSRTPGVEALSDGRTQGQDSFKKLGAVLSQLVDTYGYAPHELDFEYTGWLKIKAREVYKPQPVKLTNGALVTGRATFTPNPQTQYSADSFAPRRGAEHFAMMAPVFPYRGGPLSANRFYGTRGRMSAVIVDRITGPQAPAGGELYSISAGNAMTYGPPGAFELRRSYLVAPSLGTAVMRTFPQPGSWSGMQQEQMPPVAAEQLVGEFAALLDPEYPIMRAEEPLSGFPDVSREPSPHTPPNSIAAGSYTKWLPITPANP